MTEPRAFFAARVQAQGQPPVTRLLEGDLDPVDFEGTLGSPAPHHGLPRFADASFHAAYPLAQAMPDRPRRARRAAARGLQPAHPRPCRRQRPAHRRLPLGGFQSVGRARAGLDLRRPGQLYRHRRRDGEPKRNVNRWRVGKGLRGVDMRSEGVPADAEQWGTLALTVLDAPTRSSPPAHAWHDIPWGDALLDFWDDFSADGEIDDRPPGDADSPTASLAAAVDLDPGAERAVTFLLAWHFPNRLTWDVMRTGDDRADWGRQSLRHPRPRRLDRRRGRRRPPAGPRARHDPVRACVLRRRHPRRDQGSRPFQSQHPALPDRLPQRRRRLLRL